MEICAESELRDTLATPSTFALKASPTTGHLQFSPQTLVHPSCLHIVPLCFERATITGHISLPLH